MKKIVRQKIILTSLGVLLLMSGCKESTPVHQENQAAIQANQEFAQLQSRIRKEQLNPQNSAPQEIGKINPTLKSQVIRLAPSQS